MKDYWSGLMEHGQKRLKKITFIPPLKKDEFGWMRIGEEICAIKSWHTWDDYGYEIEIVEVTHNNGEVEEIFSDDDGDTWRHDVN
jgi:hypothetical protein